MNLLHLKYFCAIAREENISQAAQKLNIAQSALSKALSSLERDLGVRLFDRVGKHIRLNEDGRLLYQQCAYAFSLIDNAEDRIRNRLEWQEGEVVVLVDSLSPYMAHFIQQFHQKFPRIRLELAQAYDSMRLREIGAYDVSITDHVAQEREERGTVLCRDEFVLLLPKHHPLAGAGAVDLEQLRDEYFVYCCRTGDTLQAAYDAQCSMAGFAPKVFLIGADLSTTMTTVRSGQGVAFVPASAIAVTPLRMLDQVSVVKIRSPYYTNPIFLVTPSGKVRSAATDLFISFMQEYFAGLYTDGICTLEAGMKLTDQMRGWVTDAIPFGALEGD